MQICGKKWLIEGKLIRIARLDAEGFDSVEDPEAASEALRECGARVDIFTFIQNLSQTSPKYPYRMEWDNLAALRVSTFDDWMKHQIDFRARNKVRKAAKNGVEVREVALNEDLIKGISAIYNESPIRQGKRFWHYGKDLETLRRMKATFADRSTFVGAFLDGVLIGFIKLVTNEDKTQAGFMHILSMIQHRDKAPTNALIAQAVQLCADRGIPHLWYANFYYGKKREDGLAEFKRSNGFRKVDLPRYYIPLTLLGRMALRAGVHHQAREWIPEPVAAMYRRMRIRWYAKQFPGFENS